MTDARKNLIAPLGILLLMLLTNLYLSWDAGLDYLFATDAKNSYAVISEYAPGIPPIPLALHHAQRFPVPFALGALAKISHIPYQTLYQALTYLLIASITWIFWRILRLLKIDPAQDWLYFSLLFFNPYAFRYYLIAPGMVTDISYVFAVLLGCYAVLKKSFFPLCVAIWLGIICRQTILLQLPIFALWYVLAGDPSRTKQVRVLRAGVLFASTLVLFFVIKKLAHAFGTVDKSAEHLLPFIYQVFGLDTVGLKGLGELFVRVFLPLLPVLSFISVLLFVRRSLPRELHFYALFCLGLVALVQPILAGLGLTGSNGGRLGSLGLIPVILALASLMKDAHFRISYLLAGALFAGSFHHLFTWIHLPSAEIFLYVQLGVTVIAAILFSRLVSTSTVSRTSGTSSGRGK